MNCEICGIDISYSPRHVVVDGVKLLVCFECASMGESYWKPITPSFPRIPISKPVSLEKKKQIYAEKSLHNIELIDKWWDIIRKARIKQNMSQEELAKKAKEKHSIIQKIESGKMAPDIRLAKILEHILRIKLLAEHEEGKIDLKTPEKTELTLGDIIHFKKRTNEKG